MNASTFCRQRLVLALTAAALVTGSLVGCVPLVVGGAAAGAGMVATDRRSSGVQVDDQSIELRGASRIRDIANDNMNVTVVSFNRQVLLVGTVGSDADKRRAEEVVRGVANVRNVVNEIVVGPALGFPERSNDTYITGKVKASLLDTNDLFANSFKVITEGGVVYLMGIATRTETDRASNITRGVDGVRKVVRVVDIVTDAELAAIGVSNGNSSAQPGGTSGSTSPASATSGGATSGSSSRVPLPPMEPLPPASGAGAAPASNGVVTSPVR